MSATIVEIDQGQSNTSAAVLDGGVLAIFAETQSDGLYPSQMYITENETLIGSQAASGGNRDPSNFVKGWKQFAGTDKVFMAGGTRRTPLEMSALMYRKVVDDVLGGINKSIDEVTLVATVPVTYDGVTIDEYIKALQALGVKVLPQNVFQEPLAGVYHFFKSMGADIRGKKVLVVDIGGSTLDVILGVVEAVDQAYRIDVSRQRGEKLAGSKFDAIVKLELLRQMKEGGFDEALLNPKDELMIGKKSISIKERLSGQKDVHDVINLSFGSFEVNVSYDKYRSDCQALVDSILDVVGDVRGSSFEDIDMAVMIGGTSLIPFIRTSLEERFPELVGKICSDDPLKCVVYGAAELAGDMIENSRKGRHVELYTMKCPRTISVTSNKEVDGMKLLRAFPHVMKGQKSPVTISRVYCIPDNAADVLESDILVSDHETGDDFDPYDEGVEKLGTLKIPIPDHKREGTPIQLKVEFLANGLIVASSECEGIVSEAKFEWRVVA